MELKCCMVFHMICLILYRWIFRLFGIFSSLETMMMRQSLITSFYTHSKIFSSVRRGPCHSDLLWVSIFSQVHSSLDFLFCELPKSVFVKTPHSEAKHTAFQGKTNHSPSLAHCYWVFFSQLPEGIFTSLWHGTEPNKRYGIFQGIPKDVRLNPSQQPSGLQPQELLGAQLCSWRAGSHLSWLPAARLCGRKRGCHLSHLFFTH